MNKKLKEVELDIAMNAGALINMGIIEIEDSRTFISEVVPELAALFMEMNIGEYEEDYLEMVDHFSINELEKRYKI